MINALSKYKVTEDLKDGNYPTWSQSVREVFVSMRLEKFIKVPDYKDPTLSDEKNEVSSFNVTTFILNRLDDHNNTQTRNYLTDPDEPQEIRYDPYLCWRYLADRHHLITEDKLMAVTKALHSCKMSSSDTMSAYLDKYENLTREFFYYRGDLSDTQTARMLILSIPTLPETTVELIYATVKPLTRKGVSDYLRQYEQRHDWTSKAIREAHGVEVGRNKKTQGGARCTETVCVGPHPSKECWSRPENFEKKERFLARRKGQSSSNTTSTPAKTSVRGFKKVSRPSASAVSSDNVLSLHSSYGDVTAECSATRTEGLWGLHDSGSTHHVFNNRSLFTDESFKKVDSPNKRLKLAGGGVSLNVTGEGTVRFKAGDGSIFELTNCLLVPELSRNLIAGGLLKKKGVREYFDEDDPTNFALILNGLALFNGYIGTDNLMHLQLESVQKITQNSSMTEANSTSVLIHRRLGHPSDTYLKATLTASSDGKGECVDLKSGNCDTCYLAKSTKTPYNKTRPRALNFLENVHVDLSGIIRTKGLRNECYYILFNDDYSSYRHIYPLMTKTKEEVMEKFMSYLAVSERQTGKSLKQFTLDRGGEFLNNLLCSELD